MGEDVEEGRLSGTTAELLVKSSGRVEGVVRTYEGPISASSSPALTMPLMSERIVFGCCDCRSLTVTVTPFQPKLRMLVLVSWA